MRKRKENSSTVVHAIDASKVAIENVNQKKRQKNISLDLRHFKARQTLPYDSSYFDAVYSHMFYNEFH